MGKGVVVGGEGGSGWWGRGWWLMGEGHYTERGKGFGRATRGREWDIFPHTRGDIEIWKFYYIRFGKWFPT